MATSLKADISETEHFSQFFITFLKCTLNFEYLEEKDQSQSLTIRKIINCESGSYLNVQKAIFQVTLRKPTCQRLPNTAEISTEPDSHCSSVNFIERE